MSALVITEENFGNVTCTGDAVTVKTFDAGVCTDGVEINIVSGAAHVWYLIKNMKI